MASEYWYVRNRGRVTGPFSTTQLENFRRRGQLSKFHEVSQDKRSWAAATSLQGLFGDPVANEFTVGSIPVQEAEPAPQSVEAWFYNNGQAPAGPVDTRQLIGMVQSGRIVPDTQVWKQGTPNWVVLRDVPELAQHLARSANGSGSWTAPPDATNGGGPPPDPARVHRPWMILIGGVVAALVVVAVVVATLMITKYRDRGQDGIVGRGSGGSAGHKNTKNPQRIIDGALSDGIAEAVGLVVCGWIISKKDGDVVDDWESTGSCFAVTSDGYLLSNEHVVNRIQKRQRKDEDFVKLDFAETWVFPRMVDATLESWEKAGKLKDPIPKEDQPRSELKARLLKDDDFRKENLAESQAWVKARIKKVEPTVWVFFAKEKYSAKIVHVSDTFDLAVLKVDRSDGPYFRLVTDDESKFRRGVEVYSLGFPAASRESLSLEEAVKDLFRSKHARIENQFKDLDFCHNITKGIVTLVRIEEEQTRIQHSAEISGGNSGGPLIDAEGYVVGINTWVKTVSSSNILVQNYLALSIPQTLKELHREVKDMFPR